MTAAEGFYAGVLGLPVVGREPGRQVFFRAGAGSMLLIFDPAATIRGGELPPHGTTGSGHFALGVRAETLDGWRWYLRDKPRRPLARLARSASLWERRIAVVATQHFIRLGQFDDTLAISRRLLGDREDLIHKAAGWMLRGRSVTGTSRRW